LDAVISVRNHRTHGIHRKEKLYPSVYSVYSVVKNNDRAMKGKTQTSKVKYCNLDAVISVGNHRTHGIHRKEKLYPSVYSAYSVVKNKE
jgi:hypothetical protein